MYKHGITKLYTTFKVNLSCLALGEKNKFIISISTSKVFTEILTVIELIKSEVIKITSRRASLAATYFYFAVRIKIPELSDLIYSSWTDRID